ncbi:MAG: type II toxin-antitoxin system HicB family antitoxin [Ottowia sp.]|nr:type II toxin-antitoxin system HicB family antitoxin [Ottowia sp.]
MSLTYKGYTASVEYDEDDNLLWGKVDGISDGIIFHSDPTEGIRKEFQASIDDYLQWCAEEGKQPQRPTSESLKLQFVPSVSNAARAGQSLNDWLQALAARETGVAL